MISPDTDPIADHEQPPAEVLEFRSLLVEAGLPAELGQAVIHGEILEDYVMRQKLAAQRQAVETGEPVCPIDIDNKLYAIIGWESRNNPARAQQERDKFIDMANNHEQTQPK